MSDINRTGRPSGQSPMNGGFNAFGGFGFRGGVSVPGNGRNRGNRSNGRGIGLSRCSRGLHLHRGLCWNSNQTGGSEVELLRRDAQHLEASLDQIKKRLSALENQESKEE